MSTIDRPQSRVLPLISGQAFDQPTFHELYAAMPSGTWAELVGGVVFMPSPLFFDHGGSDFDLSGWLFHYQRFTPGLRGVSNVSTILGLDAEVQPDLQLRIREQRGGQARVEGGYVVGLDIREFHHFDVRRSGAGRGRLCRRGSGTGRRGRQIESFLRSRCQEGRL